jgi:hypothetical protein
MATLIRSVAEALAGEASAVAVAGLGGGEVLTACRDGSGDLLLIGWLAGPGEISRAGDSGGQAGEVSEVALAVLGRRAVTAVRDGGDNLLMITWDVPPGLASITRPFPESAGAGEVTAIAITPLRADLLVTAVRNGSDNLELISWRLQSDGTVSRLHDSGEQAGTVTTVTITALDDDNLITAVRNGSNELELIGWAVDAAGGLTRWPGEPGRAGLVGQPATDPVPTDWAGMIALATVNGTAARTVLTAVVNGSGDLLLITWTADPASGFTRRVDTGAGQATKLAITTTTTAGVATVLVSMREGDGNLKVIAFDLLGEPDAMVLIRTGDHTGSDVTETTLLTLDADHVLTACRTDGNLDLTAYELTPAPMTLIRSVAEAVAGEASAVAVAGFGSGEVLTACRDGSGNLLLIGWLAPPGEFAITRAADSGSQAGEVSAVALAVLGRRAVSAVRDGGGNLLMITWDVPPGLASITRPFPESAGAGEVSAIAITPLRADLLVTAVRNGGSNLELISWRLQSDGTVSRLHDSGDQAGTVTTVTITAVDDDNVITAVRNGSNELELIGWAVDAAGGLTRWPGEPGRAGLVGRPTNDPVPTDWAGMIALATVNGPAVTTVLTAVVNGSGELLLIAWTADPDHGFTRRVDTGAGQATKLAITTTTTAGIATVLVSMREGDDNLKVIVFDLLGEPDAMLLLRTGDYTNRADSDVAETTLLTLAADHVLTACRTDDHLDLTTYEITDAASVRPAPRSILGVSFPNIEVPAPIDIQAVAEALAGEASAVAVAGLGGGEVLTACRDGSGDLLLIGWLAPAGQITRAADSGGQAGEVSEVALAVLGRRAVTAVRDGGDNLLMISWDVPPGLGAITRPFPEGVDAGEVSAIAITTLRDDLLVTAVRNGSDNLELISWRLQSDGTLSRLHDSGEQAGAVTTVTITALDDDNVITAVRNGRNELELIGWSVDGAGVLTRWPGQPGRAGAVGLPVNGPVPVDWVGLIALTTVSATLNGTPVTAVLTAVVNGSGELLLIAWTADPANGFTRQIDTGAGKAAKLAISATVTTAGIATVLVSMRQGDGNLKLIAFDLLGQPDAMVLIRTGDWADGDTTQTTLLTLDADHVLTACRTDGNLDLTAYQLTPTSGILDWAVSRGEKFPLDRGHEWVQVFAPVEEYDDATLVGAAGWVIAPENSSADVPMTHVLGFDWEFHVALDDESGYQSLLSPAAIHSEDVRLQLAALLGLEAPKGLLGVEWEKDLLPPSFRGQVDHGDRVAVFGRWIIDTGHDFDGHFKSEIHPPLLMASASVQTSQPLGRAKTRMLMVSRPYLQGQQFAQDVNHVYADRGDDDGSMFDHLVHEMRRVVTGRSLRVEAHPKIKERPYRGRHELRMLVQPPPEPAADHDLVVSYQFTVRSGVDVRISAQSADQVDVVVDLGPMRTAPPLPPRSDRVYQPDQLDKLSSGVGLEITLFKLAGEIAGQITGVTAPFVYLVLRRGILTDEYAPLPAVDIDDASHAVTDVLAQNITAGGGILVDDTQPWPVMGWLEASWVPVSPQWSYAESLGGVFDRGPGAASQGSGMLDVFGVGTDWALYHKGFDDGRWNDWESLGGSCQLEPAAVSWGSGRIDCFTCFPLANRRPLQHKSFDNGRWSDWENLGGDYNTGPAAASWGVGRLDVFGVGNSAQLFHGSFENGSWSKKWESLGGKWSSAPAAVSWGVGRIDCFVRGTDHAMWHIWFDRGRWSDWEGLGGNFISGPGAASRASGHLDVFGVGADKALYQNIFDDGRWSGWQSLGGTCTSNPAAVSSADNRIDCFVQGADRSMVHRSWAGPPV